MGADCADAGQEFVPSSALFSAAGSTLRKAPRKRKREAPARAKKR